MVLDEADGTGPVKVDARIGTPAAVGSVDRDMAKAVDKVEVVEGRHSMRRILLMLVFLMAGCAGSIAPEAVPSGDNAGLVRFTVIVIGGDTGRVPVPLEEPDEEEGIAEMPDAGEM